MLRSLLLLLSTAVGEIMAVDGRVLRSIDKRYGARRDYHSHYTDYYSTGL